MKNPPFILTAALLLTGCSAEWVSKIPRSVSPSDTTHLSAIEDYRPGVLSLSDARTWPDREWLFVATIGSCSIVENHLSEMLQEMDRLSPYRVIIIDDYKRWPEVGLILKGAGVPIEDIRILGEQQFGRYLDVRVKNEKLFGRLCEGMDTTPAWSTSFTGSNPAQDQVTFVIDHTLLEDGAELVVRDLHGREVHGQRLKQQEGEVVWDTRSIAQGTYTVVLRQGKDKVKSETLIIQK